MKKTKSNIPISPMIKYGELSIKEKIHKLLEYLDLANSNKANRLTPLELQLLTEFLCLDAKYTYYRFSTICKRIIQANFIKEYNKKLNSIHLNNKLKDLEKKGWLTRDEDNQMAIKPVLQIMINKLELDDLTLVVDFRKT